MAYRGPEWLTHSTARYMRVGELGFEPNRYFTGVGQVLSPVLSV